MARRFSRGSRRSRSRRSFRSGRSGRSARRVSRGGRGSRHTVRIELVQGSTNAIARPQLVQKPLQQRKSVF